MVKTYIISNSDKESLIKNLSETNINPYECYKDFKEHIHSLIIDNKIPPDLLQMIKEIKIQREHDIEKAFLIKNCPLDYEIPIFDHLKPVEDKYIKKKTFIGEGFLEIFSELSDNPLLAYDTRNNGDFFHDVYAQDQFSQTQTQKSDSELFLHNDRTAHPVRADYLNLLGMRCSKKNQILTSYVDGKKVLEFISDEHQNVLREKLFYTPYDEYSRSSNTSQMTSAPHSILTEQYSLRYYETRTLPIETAPSVAFDAYISFRNAIIKAKKSCVDIQTGELFTFPNQFGLHSRTFIQINNKEEAKKRWLLKTYAFRNSEYMRKFSNFFGDVDGLVLDNLAVE